MPFIFPSHLPALVRPPSLISFPLISSPHQLILAPQWNSRPLLTKAQWIVSKGLRGFCASYFPCQSPQWTKKLQLVAEMANGEFWKYYSYETFMQNTKIKLWLKRFTPSRTTEYVVFVSSIKGNISEMEMASKQVLSDLKKNLCTTRKEDKNQKLEHTKFLFVFTNDGAVIELMFLPICVTAFTIQLYHPKRVSQICYFCSSNCE